MARIDADFPSFSTILSGNRSALVTVGTTIAEGSQSTRIPIHHFISHKRCGFKRRFLTQ